MTNQSRNYIPSLNGLRAVSVVLVLFHHFELYYRYPQHFIISEFNFLYYNGELGVNIFFVISGFLITRLLLREEAATGTNSLRNFYFRRTLRIFPAYYFLLIVYYFMQVKGLLYLQPSSWITSITYTKNFASSDWYTSHAWSLALEEQFYLFWPFLFVYFKKHRNRVAIALVCIVPVLRAAGYYFSIPMLHPASLFCRVDALMWGCLFAVHHNKILPVVKAWLARYRWAAYLPFAAILFLYYFNLVNQHYHLRLGLATVAFGSPNGTIIYISIGLLMMVSIHHTKSYWFRFLNTGLLNYIGKLSYSTYLWQQVFISTYFTLAQPPVNLLCIFIMANFSYYFVERPFLQWRSKKDSKEVSPIPAATSNL